MDEEQQHGENEVENDTERKTTEDPSNYKHSSVNGNEEEAVPVEMVVSDHREENPEEPPIEAVNPEPEENIEKEIHGVDMSTSQDLGVKLSEVSEQPLSFEERVGLEVNSSYDEDSGRLHVETIAHVEEEEEESDEEESSAAAAADKADISNELHAQLLLELCEERDTALQRSSQLQTKLAEYLHKKAGDIAQLERQAQVSERLQEYEKGINLLNDLKQTLAADTETAQQQEEELRLQCQEKLDEVENEWRAFMSLKQDVAVTVLSRRLGKQAAQAKVEATLAAEQLRQDQLIKLRLKYIKLKVRIHRLEAELRDEEEHGRDPLQLQFEKLQAQRLEQKQHIERQSEEMLKLQKKISGSLELLSNVKEKLYWNQMEVVAKREQLAEVEAMVARKRDLLTRTKQACNSLQRDNQRLKESRGLLGNRLLLQDFEDTVDAAEKLEEQLKNLKCRETEIAISCGRSKKPMTT